MRKIMVAALVAWPLSGCVDQVRDLAREPRMSPIGAGLNPPAIPLPIEPTPAPVVRPGNSVWQDSSSDLFRDPRATKIGDVVTIKISIKDKASLDNSTERSRDSKRNFDFDTSFGTNYSFWKSKGDGKINSAIKSETSTKGEGAIARSENIDLLVAAVVTDVLPNGNLMVSGLQEVRVNYEVRVLSVAGVVRPRDISTDNTISYEKVAEARISYGGRGRITEVQQPAWGQQILDLFFPF